MYDGIMRRQSEPLSALSCSANAAFKWSAADAGTLNPCASLPDAMLHIRISDVSFQSIYCFTMLPRVFPVSLTSDCSYPFGPVCLYQTAFLVLSFALRLVFLNITSALQPRVLVLCHLMWQMIASKWILIMQKNKKKVCKASSSFTLFTVFCLFLPNSTKNMRTGWWRECVPTTVEKH